jgi:hypothetical protein
MNLRDEFCNYLSWKNWLYFGKTSNRQEETHVTRCTHVQAVRIHVRQQTYECGSELKWRIISKLQRSLSVSHTAKNWCEFYSLFAELMQNHGGRTFKQYWGKDFRRQGTKNLFQGTKNASVLDDNRCESRGITVLLNTYCSYWGYK